MRVAKIRFIFETWREQVSEQVFNKVIEKLQSKFPVDHLSRRDILYAMEKLLK